ncbi:MAG: hypothetical protein INR66_27270 [Gordonia polyisoprenivorans]|nr:hypothetical protein [Gordonia polyisoprenivorans]
MTSAAHHDGHRVVQFVGKGGKTARLPIPPTVGCILDEHIGGRDTGALLLRRDGTPYNYAAARRAVITLAKLACVDRTVTPHAFRRTWTSAGLDAGISARETIRRTLGKRPDAPPL